MSADEMGDATGALLRSLLAVWVLALASANVDIMRDVTLGFGEALKHCREESKLTETQMEEFFHFWREDFRFEHRELGCAMLCMSKRFNLLTDVSRMHHENTDKFIKSFTNGEQMAQKMIEFIHNCEQKFDAIEDHCMRILRIAECFKTTCVQQKLAPSMELLMAEFIMDAE